MTELLINIGGLLRCCIHTIQHYKGPNREGQVLVCPHCKGQVVVENGIWRWKV